MPTWREWIADEDERLEQFEGTKDFTKTNYFIKWKSFLISEKLKLCSIKYKVRFVFFPHRNMQKYLKYFPRLGSHIEIVGGSNYDVQYLLKKAALLVTDYSSIFFDFIYMKKPIIFYQFDYATFRKGQYGEGYFDYSNNSFAKSFENENEVFEKIRNYIETEYKISDEYLLAHKKYFKLYDKNNCKRVYDVVNDT